MKLVNEVSKWTLRGPEEAYRRGREVRRLREFLGLSMGEAAQVLGVRAVDVARLEWGACVPENDVAGYGDIARALWVSRIMGTGRAA